MTRRRGDDEPVIPERAQDDADAGWGEPGAHDGTEDDERILRERPPHW